ncbi:unnamed protein product, partial [Sphagnum balticum]
MEKKVHDYVVSVQQSPSPALPPPPSLSQLQLLAFWYIMAVAVLFAAVVFIICLHIYAKWFWRHQGAVLGMTRSSSSWRRRRRQTVVESLPTFVYKKTVFPQEITDMSESLSQLQQQELECAVCLEEFEENEMGRTLPKCAHSYHVECIDMWLYSHSNCPICRASARPNGPAG